MKIKAVDPETGEEFEVDPEDLDLEKGASKRKKLSDDLVKRVKNFKELLKEVETSPLDETIENFRKDMHPEREIKIWERIAFRYDAYISENEIADLRKKEDVYRIMLFESLGSDDYHDSVSMTDKEMQEVADFYHDNKLD